ncbi:MAG: head GIN domain-containing protein [Candidatus Cyclobacteriaceae bacterium M3_2C_046]
MKKLFFPMLFTLLLYSGVNARELPQKDTITIQFGNNSKILIYVTDQSDLKALQNYDINKMLKDLSLSIDSADQDVQYLKIEDQSGTKYLEDTTIVLDEKEIEFEIEGYRQEFELGPFDKLEIGGIFEILVRKGQSHRLIANGDPDDIEDLIVSVSNQELNVKYNSFLRNRNKVKLFILTPSLKGIDFSGASKSTVLGFESENLVAQISGAAKANVAVVAENIDIKQSGASKLQLMGKGQTMMAELSGASSLDADNFKVEDALVETSGAASARVNATNQTRFSSSGAGSIRNVSSADRTVTRPSSTERPQGANDNIRNGEMIDIKIGNHRLSVEARDWDDFEDDFDDIESYEDFEERLEKKEYLENEAPKVAQSLNLEFGMNNYLENGEFPDASGAEYAVKPWGSWFVGLNYYHKFHLGGPVFLEWGKGISWYNFKFEDPQTRIYRLENQLDFGPDTVHTNAIKSKLTTSYFNMSLIPMFDFSRGQKKVKSYSFEGFHLTKYKKRGFRIGAGPYLGYRLGSHSKYVYKNGGREKDKDRGNFMLNNWRYGIRLQAGYKALDVFFNYDLNNLFVGDNNPELNAFSFGIIL